MHPAVLVIGELNVDFVLSGLAGPPRFGGEILAQDMQMVLGSASAIFASGVARLGHPVGFISKVGSDQLGQLSSGAGGQWHFYELDSNFQPSNRCNHCAQHERRSRPHHESWCHRRPDICRDPSQRFPGVPASPSLFILFAIRAAPGFRQDSKRRKGGWPFGFLRSKLRSRPGMGRRYLGCDRLH